MKCAFSCLGVVKCFESKRFCSFLWRALFQMAAAIAAAARAAGAKAEEAQAASVRLIGKRAQALVAIGQTGAFVFIAF